MDFSQVVWLILGFLLLLVWIWVVFAVVVDVVRRSDLSGVATVAWCVFVFVVPLIGVIVYFISRPKLTPDEAEAVTAYQRKVAADSEERAAQLAELSRRHTIGEITDEEYERQRSLLE